jgi:hypothetical protein
LIVLDKLIKDSSNCFYLKFQRKLRKHEKITYEVRHYTKEEAMT